jgi:hypothetical protein
VLAQLLLSASTHREAIAVVAAVFMFGAFHMSYGYLTSPPRGCADFSFASACSCGSRSRRNGTRHTVFLLAVIVGYLFVRVKATDWPPPGMPRLRAGLSLATFVLLAGSVTIHRAVIAIRNGERTWSTRWLEATLALRGHYGSVAYSGITYAAMYWHFLDAIWLLFFAVLVVFASADPSEDCRLFPDAAYERAPAVSFGGRAFVRVRRAVPSTRVGRPQRGIAGNPRKVHPRVFVHCLHQPSGLMGPRTVLHVAQVVSTGAGTKFRQLKQNWSSLSECCLYWFSTRVAASAGWSSDTSEQSRLAPSCLAFSRNAARSASPEHPVRTPAPANVA